MKNKAYIVASGDRSRLDFVPAPDDFVIAVDGGYDYLLGGGIRIDLLVGDMDSIKHVPENIEKIVLEREKDDTDTLAAVKIGIAQGYEEFHIYCGTGGRLSHTVANIQTLEFLAKQKKRGFLFSENGTATVIRNEKRIFSGTGLLSIFSLSPETTVTTKGLKYPLKNQPLASDFPLGISNEFTGAEAKITAHDGSLLIVYDE